MKHIVKTTCLALMSVYGINSYADNTGTIVTFANKTPYTLTLNSVDLGTGDYCVDNTNSQVNCASLILPAQQQKIYIANQSGSNLNYIINATTKNQNNFNLNIQNYNNISYSATAIQGAATALNAGNSTITFSVPKTTLPIPTAYNFIPFRGVNLSGAEAGSNYMSAWLPSIADDVYFLQKGMNTVRLPINWNYISSQVNGGTINQDYLNSIYNTTQQLLLAGDSVIIDLHDYMRYQYNASAGSGNVVSPDDMQFIWNLLATKLAPLAKNYAGGNSQPQNQLIFELMNEPYGMATSDVLTNSNAAIAAIRATGLTNLILIDGNLWTGLHSWTTGTGNDGKTNSQVFTASSIKDNNYAIAVHEYFDSDGSGTAPTCQPLSQFQPYVNWAPFITWMQQNKMKVFLSEFGSGPTSSTDPNCADDVNWLLTQMEQNAYNPSTGGFIGWTAWVGGHGWNLSNFNNLTPDTSTGTETSQMINIYEKHLTIPNNI